MLYIHTHQRPLQREWSDRGRSSQKRAREKKKSAKGRKKEKRKKKKKKKKKTQRRRLESKVRTGNPPAGANRRAVLCPLQLPALERFWIQAGHDGVAKHGVPC